MPEPTYTPAMQANIAKADNWLPLIAGASPQITNIDALWDTTRDTPLGTPREAFRIAYREYRDHLGFLELVNRLPEEDLTPRSWHKDGFQHMSSNYLYVTTFTGYDTTTGEMKDESLTIESDEPLTIGELNDKADEIMGQGDYGLEIQGLTSAWTDMYHKHGAEW